MTFTPPSRDTLWRDIPDGILQQDQQQQTAAQWGANARSEVAQMWADNARAELGITPSDSLTNPLGTGNATPDAGAAVSSAPATSSPEPMPDQSQPPAGPVSSFPPSSSITSATLTPPTATATLPSQPAAPQQPLPTGSSTVLDRNGVVNYVQQRAANFGLDPAAVLAVANQEGLNTAPGSSWQLKGEGNISFGPPSWYGNGAGSSILQQHGQDAARWSWTPEGIDYWLSQVAQAAKGLTGGSAIQAIVHGFERPREDLAAGEIKKAQDQYANFQGGPVAASIGAPDLGPQTTVMPTQPSQNLPPALDFSSAVNQARDALGQTAGNVVQGATQGFADAVQGARDALSKAGAAVVQGAPAVANVAGAGLGVPTDQAAQGAQTVGNFLTEPQPWMQNVYAGVSRATGLPVPVGPTTGGPQKFVDNPNTPLTPEQQYVLGRSLLTGLSQTVGPEELIARGSTSGAGSLARSAGVAEDLAKSRQPAQAEVGFAAGMPTGGAAAESGYQSVMPKGTFEAPTPPTPALSNRFQSARTALVRAFTDRGVDLSQAQQAYQRALGRPLNADEMASELSRLAADPAAEVKIDEGLKPAIQAVETIPNGYQALRDYVTLRSNVQVAKGTATTVQEEMMARNVPPNLRDDLNAANTSLRMRQDSLNALLDQSVQDPTRIQLAQRRVSQAQRAVQQREGAVNDWITRNTQQAATTGANAAERRRFSGGLTVADSEQRIQQLQDQLGPQRFQQVQQAADQVSQFSRELRQRLVDSGVLTADQAAQMESMYPDWAKTRILQYMDDPAGGQVAGTKIGLSSRDLHKYTLEGTTAAREDPLASTVAYAHQVERMAMKNEAFNAFLKLDQQSDNPLLRQVSQDFTPTRNQVTIAGFVDGQKVKYVTDNKALGNAINGAGVVALPEWATGWQRFVRATATSRNPVFLAGNAALDIPEYTIRSTIREGGPQAIPRVLGQLAKGYADAFQGLLQGEYRGAGTAEFLKAGGGQSGYFTGGEGLTRQTIAELRRPNVFAIQNAGDLGRLLKDIVTLKPVEALGERIELGPRVAAYNLAKARGANSVQAAIEGRTVTIDFAQGGTVTKFLNQFIPFFNVGFQGPVQVARAFHDNPKAWVASVGSLIGLPTIAAEIWNNANPQRAQDYADVPQYLKDQGIVVMLPGDASVDAQGNRKPAYVWLNARNWAPLVVAARQAVDSVAGTNPQTWQGFLGSASKGALPVTATSAGDLGSRFQLAAPGIGAAMQLGLNKDFFRNRDIVTNRNDEQASATAKALTPMVQAVIQQFAPNAEVHPSAIEFAIRDQLAGVGGAALGAGDILLGAPRPDTSSQSLPVAGGIVSRFVKNAGGEQLQQARSQTITPEARQILRTNGITETPGPVSDKVNGIPLKQDEMARYQQLANQYIDAEIKRLATDAQFRSSTPLGKQRLADRVIQMARTRAGLQVLNSIPDAEKIRRRQTGTTAP